MPGLSPGKDVTLSVEVFASGDTIKWSPDKLGTLNHPRELYGDGPFTVVVPTQVPRDCSFPDTYCAFGRHNPHCNVAMFESVAHPQWVSIRLPNGNVPQDTLVGGDSRFSGIWFVHA